MTDGEHAAHDRYVLGETERRAVFVRGIVPHELERAQRVPRPRVVYIGGQPGAGKSALQDRLRDQLEATDGRHSVLEINNDRFRLYHPRYRELQRIDDQRASVLTNPDANAWVDLAIDASRTIRSHVFLESSLRRTDEILKTTRGYRDAGFGAELHLVVTHPLISRISVAERYLGQIDTGQPGRYVVTDTQQEAIDLLPRSLRALADSGLFSMIGLHQRSGVDILTGTPGPWLTPDAIVDAYRAAVAEQAAALERTKLLRRVEVALAQAEHYGRRECAVDLRRLRGDVEGIDR
ncbi:zeta toxin family protein [Patulibacter sp. NPDC049589]|uniref:zeta toxin family protein n=1 Tax=Patulibacter sp. NPDC049589 TaxID=3154731 RepID=UPI0034186E37